MPSKDTLTANKVNYLVQKAYFFKYQATQSAVSMLRTAGYHGGSVGFAYFCAFYGKSWVE